MLNPETITVIDPACGSGHILVEAYDVLKAIYLERGYQLRSIPRLILEKNLYGLDIDDRAAQLAGFALLMKARADDRRLFDELPKLNVYSIQSSKNLNLPLLWRQLDLNGQGKIGTTSSLFDEPQTDLVQVVDDSNYQLIKNTLALFEQAQTLGSLIQVPAEHAEPLKDLLAQLQALTTEGNNFQKIAATTLIPFIRQAVILAMQFDAVVANPPYMGGKGMNPALKEFAKREFPDSKSDLFAMFMERGFQWCKPVGFNAMVTMQSWMFLSSYQGMREKLLANRTINTMAHLGARAFSEISGEVVQTTAFVLLGQHFSGYKPAFFRLIDGQEEQKQAALRSGQNRFDRTVQDDFKKIPGSPVAYWVNHHDIFSGSKLSKKCVSGGRTKSHNDGRYVRQWWEITANFIEDYWVWFEKGGDFRRWYGNKSHVIDWKPKAVAFYETQGGLCNKSLWWREGITWSDITSSNNGFRYKTPDSQYSSVSPTLLFENQQDMYFVLGLLNSCASTYFSKVLNPTIHLNVGDVLNFPLPQEYPEVNDNVVDVIEIAKNDWDFYETSRDFQSLPWLPLSTIPTLQRGNAGSDAPASRNAGALPDEFPRRSVGTINASTNLEQCFNRWQMQNRAAILEMQRLEKENNRLFIEAYGLQDELSPEVPEDQITLTHADREKDSQRLISYAIGCMMGRYRLDKPGLIYAHAGNVDFDKIYYGTDSPPFEKGGPGGILHITQAESEEQNQEQIPPNPPFSKGGIFAPDADGIVPITDELWFEDDAANRLNEFLLAVWDAETLEENKSWLAESLGQKGNETPQQTIRRYIAGSFYKNHLQTYKKRPIYWLFSSGKQGAFQALVYLHRYNESTLARMRAEYVVPLTGKIQSRIEMLKKDAAVASSNAEKSKLDKDIDKLGKKYVELLSFDEKLRHYADLRILLDLDDGVKVNYGKFGDLLAEVKSVTGGTGND
ncbi:MAG: BREX-1 system adenine-specific DNA-methyltransferase PglX [Methylobacter sp.]|nr:BREX-1 system adenine-specific DNA-methyltransferase PglX [Methylobacter sp.]